MNRLTFCDEIKHIRKESKIPMKSICFSMDVMPTAISRLENGSNNFNLKLLLSYLRSINAHLVLTYQNSHIAIIDYDQFIDWLINIRNINYSQRSLAEKINVSYTTIANIERKATVISIDTFLKISEALGVEIKIEKCN